MDAPKFKAVVHYICIRCRERSQILSMAQLHSILWRADGETYRLLGQGVVDEQYVRQLGGPESVHLTSTIDLLTREGRLETRTASPHTAVVDEPVARGRADSSHLSTSEANVLDRVIEDVLANWLGITLEHSAQATGSPVHDSGETYRTDARGEAAPVWMAAAIGEPISYRQQLLAAFPPLTEVDQQWIQSELKRLR